MSKILNWGLLSTARINRALIPPLQVSKRNHLFAVASRSQEAADAYAKEKKIPRAYGSYEALLADPEIDVIYNPLPNHLHAEWTIKAVEAGKHVLCEKPLALTVTEVDAIHAAAHKVARSCLQESTIMRGKCWNAPTAKSHRWRKFLLAQRSSYRRSREAQL
jgi:predicted dehydrogenase